MNTVLSKAQFLPAADRQIFSLHYPAGQPERNETIILCPPAPQETMRSQAALGQLARRLQEDGFHVIRFDYSGTGDSEGFSDQISLDHWLLDLLSVYGWAQFHLRTQKISLLGLRLGAPLAIRASQQVNVERLVLWDPIIDGLNYLHDMEKAHVRQFQLNANEPPFPSLRYSGEQCMGFPWTSSWRAELAGISKSTLHPKAKKTHFVLSATDTLVRETCTLWQNHGLVADIQHVAEPLDWGSERYVKIRAFPAAHLRRIQALWEVQ